MLACWVPPCASFDGLLFACVQAGLLARFGAPEAAHAVAASAAPEEDEAVGEALPVEEARVEGDGEDEVEVIEVDAVDEQTATAAAAQPAAEPREVFYLSAFPTRNRRPGWAGASLYLPGGTFEGRTPRNRPLHVSAAAAQRQRDKEMM